MLVKHMRRQRVVRDMKQRARMRRDEFLADGHCSTALKERKEHKRSFPAYWIVEVLPPKPAFTDSRGNRHRHLRYLDHSPPYQGRVACRQSSVLVFELE